VEIPENILRYLLIPAFKAFVIINIMAVMAGVLTLVERRVLAWLQIRKGPNRVGPQGSLQWVADTIKLMLKEDIVPAKAEPIIHFLAPVLVVIPALTVFAVIPWGPEFTVRLPGIGKVTTAFTATDINVGLLFVLAVTSVGIYGIILGGWASNSKFALLGGLRSAAQLISYEVPMGFAVVSVILMSRSLSLVEIVEAQRDRGLWFIFPGLVAFFLYFLSGVAETNRVPFDLPEAESELVAGFHTEYSGVKWSFFFLGEYANMVTISSIATTLFFGGWLRPFPGVKALAFLDIVPPLCWFLLKVTLFMVVYIWFRGTFPRYRFDQLMDLGWKTLIPLSLANLVVVAIAALNGYQGLRILGGILWGVFLLALVLTLRSRKRSGEPAPGIPPRPLRGAGIQPEAAVAPAEASS
jgi:NADH-quinone oxidoreductase subunit H